MSYSKSGKKILILTSNVGSGHLSIAEAYKQLIKDNLPASEILILNTSIKMASWAYRYVTSYLGKTYFRLWNYTNTYKRSALMHKLHIFVNTKKILKNIQSFEPDLIISTNAFSASPAYRALKLLKLKIPIIVVVADPFTPHLTWTVFKKADLYLSPTVEAKELLIESRIPAKKINITGWPVRKVFYEKYKKTKNSKIQVLLTSGGEGLSYVRAYLLAALSSKQVRENFMFNVICARNKELHLAMQLIKKLYPGNVEVYEFVKDIHILMRNADIVVGKPGPNFLYEAITLEKPFIAIGDLIGQEKGNCDYILNNKIGKYFSSHRGFKEYLSLYMQKHSEIDKEKLKRLSELQRKTSENIWGAIKSYLN